MSDERQVPPIYPGRPVSYAVQTEKSSPKFARAFSLGCRGIATPNNELLPGPVALFGSPQRIDLLQQARAEGRDWYYADHGYFRRFQYYRITKNAMQFQPKELSKDDQRWKALRIETAPEWKTDGSAIVICPNSPTYMAWFGIDARQWCGDLVARLSAVTDRPIIVRWKAQAAARPLYVDLHTAWLVVTFTSACAIDALIAGVPVSIQAPWATGYDFGEPDLARAVAQPYYPPIEQRDRLLFTLAQHQWTLQEIEAGHAWRSLSRA